MPSAWILHIKKFAAENNLSYACSMTDPRCKGTYVKVKKPTKKELKQQLGSALSKLSFNKPSFVGADGEEVVFAPAGKALSLAERVRNELERERLQESVPNVNPKNISMRGIEIKKPYVAPAAAKQRGPKVAAAVANIEKKKKPLIIEEDDEPAAAKPEKKKKGTLAAAVAALEEEAFGSRSLNKALLKREAKSNLGLYPPHPEEEEPSFTSEELKVIQLYRDRNKMKERIQSMPYEGPDKMSPKKLKYLKERNAPLVQIEKKLYEAYGIKVKRDFETDLVNLRETKNRNLSLGREIANFSYKHNLPTLKKNYEKLASEVREYGNLPHNTLELKYIKATLDVIERENIPDKISVFGYFLEKYGNFFGEDNQFYSIGPGKRTR